MSEYSSAYYQRNREKYLARANARYAADREGAKARNNARYHANAAQYLVRARNKRYGLKPGEFEALYESQKQACAICLRRFPCTGRKGLHVDHDHATGRVRGLLCPDCNTLLARAHDNRKTLRRAVRYLKPLSERS